MAYVSLQVNCPGSTVEDREIIVSLLGEFDFTMFEEDEDRVIAYGSSELVDEVSLMAAKEAVTQFAESFEVTSHQKENWNEVWEKNYFSPVEINHFVRIAAPFHPLATEPFEFEITIQPKMSFGTGNHATTESVIKLIEKYRNEFEGATVLDMGAGTGILGIVAGKLKASQITCIDIEDWAAENCLENFHENNLQNVQSLCGDAKLLQQFSGNTFKVIFANIQKSVLLADMALYNDCLQRGGRVYFSGFYEKDLADIRAKAEELGLKQDHYTVLNEWCAAVFVK